MLAISIISFIRIDAGISIISFIRIDAGISIISFIRIDAGYFYYIFYIKRDKIYEIMGKNKSNKNIYFFVL